MAGQTATMEFPVSISAQISNLKDLRTTLTNTLNAAGKDSSLAKTLTKDLAKVNQLISEAEEFTLSPTIDAAGLKALEGTFNKFFRQMQTSLQTIDLASFEQMASADDIARLKELTAEAAKYRRELEAINKSGSAEQTGKVLERTGNQDIAQRGSAYKEFNATATLNKNAAAMGKAADAYAQQAAAMQAGIDKLAQELSQAEANSEKAKNKAKILEQNLAAVNIDTRAADFHHKAGRFATNYSAEQNVKNPTLDTIQSGLRATLESVYAGGKIATDMRATVKDWIKNLLPDVKDVDADNMVKKSVNDLLEDLMEGIFGSDYRSNPNLSYNVHHARILGNAQSYSAREIGRINAQYGVSGGQDLKVISADISRELKQVRAEEREYTSDVDKKLTSWDEATDRQKEFTEAAAGARQLANELENLAKAEQEAARAAKEAQIEENEQNQLELKNARASGVKDSGAPGRQKMGDYKTDAKEVFDDAGEVLGGKQAQIDEAAQFTANLKQSIKSWMSAQQIINLVKQGIRQAYQDIQGLDKAMTNIAVVTDMSVGDLWGKINEYMSIAQQYGVSTQGVYEVSQLYYQQGLGTADVMAATTETLKMARIAGMDYAEAADAMTVAIRSFKMEMSDAAHVTDVYSKVAAVTASDSEELAIAMSKTASSAESVGSSFENTTAMLAVMIETTRESAQNLGSALKSIISRYGEMKVGATVDAEGEALDYNKVDTALKSVGISIKDAQGQFRDFDEVIFELSEKWDSLDSVTQRYIATIMAGNRQQSRFIALVDNWERLDEVAGAAQDSEDAGLLQYAKTLDSLETKITNIKTSFQEFYMSLVNGPVVGAALEGINNILKGFNKLGNWQAILNIAGFIRSVKSIAKLLVSAISPSFSSIVTDYKSAMSEMVNAARQAGYDSAKAFQEGQNAAQNGQPAPTSGSGSTPAQQSWLSARMIGDKSGKTSWGSNSWNGSKMAGRVQIGGQLIGAAASIVGSSVAKDNQRAGAVISGVGNIAQGASMGAALGPWGAVIGGVIGGLASLPAVLDAFDPASVLQEKLEKAEEALSEANIERATKREEARNLEATINNLEKLQKARYSSEEAEQAFIDASNAAFEQFPQLTATFDEAGNAIIDVINNSAEAEYLLVEARKQAAEATVLAASAELKVAQTKLEQSNLKMAKNQEAFVQYIVPGGRAYEGELEQAFSSFRKDANSIFDSQAKIDYQTAVYDRAGRWDERLNKMTPSAQLERDLIYATSMADFITAYERGRERIANGEDVTGGMALVLEKADSVMETVIEGTSSEGTWRERYNLQLQENQQLQESVRAGQKAVGYAYTNQLITNADPLNEANWKKINNSSSFLQKWVYEQAQLTDGDFVDGELTSDAMARVSQRFQSTLVDYESFFTSLGYQFEDFNNVIASASKGTLSSATLLDQFQALFGSDMSTWGSVVEQYWLTISGDIESNITRLKQDLKSNRAYDWSSYIKGEEYQQAIQSLPIAYFSQISEFADDIDTRLQSGTLTNTQAEKIIKEYFKTLSALTSDTLGLTSSQLSEAQQLLTEAASNGSLFSITGIQELITQLADAGIDIEELDLDQFPVYTANLITEWASFEDKLVSNLTAATEAMQKASEGMTLEEATSLANRIDLDLTTDFEFIDGKWFTTNIKAIKAYYTAQTNVIKEKFNEQVGKLLGTDTSSGLFEGITEQTLNDLKGKKTVESLGENATEEQITLWQAVKTYWDQEHYQAWVANTKKEVGEDADTSLATYWAEYFTNLGQTIETATAEALEYWTNESQKQAEAATRLATLKSQSQVQADKISAYETIASQGVKGYSSEDLNTIIGALGWDNSYYAYDSTTGAYDLTEKALNSIPLLYRNQILASIDAEVQAAAQSIESLGGNIFDASDADYSEAFSYLVKAGFQGKDIKQGINYALMEAIVGDPKQLEEYIGRELAYKMGRTYDEDGVFAAEFSEKITETRENMVAASKDQITKQYGRFAEILQKKILGTATFEELEELNDLELKLNLDLSSFTGRLVDDLTSFAQEIIDNAYLSTEDKQKYLQAAFGSILDIKAYSQIFGVDETAVTPEMAAIIPDVYSSNKELRSSRNRLSQDKAKEMMANYALAMGIQPETLRSLVTFNESDLTFSFGKGKTPFQMMKDTIWAIAETDSELKKQLKDSGYNIDNITFEKLAEVVDNADNAQALNVLGSAELFEQLADAQLQSGYFDQEYRAEKYISAVESFASGQEMTFEELTKLYQDLGLTFDTAELYRLWLSGPEALAAELLKLGTDSSSGLTNEQKKQIQNAQDRGVETLLNNIASIVDKVIEGSATLDDLFSLGKNLGISLSGKVYKTSSGYGLTQEGLVEVAGARAMRTGDYTTEGRLLVESYYGHGGMFDNVAALEAEISSRLGDKFEVTDLDIAGTLLKQASTEYERAISDWNIAQQNWERANEKDAKDKAKANVEERKRQKEQKELDLAQAKVLQAALAAATRREAENAANFMGIDPFDGAAEHYKNYKSSRETAQTALQEAYQNKGFIKDFNQAGQLLRFIGYGEGWDPETRREKLSTIFKYDSDKGVNFAAVLREVLGDSYNFTGMTDAEVLLEAARLMNDSEKKMEQKMYEDQLANETWGQTQKEIIADSKKRLVPEGATVDGFITSKKVGEEMVSTLDSARLSEYVAKTYGKLGLTKEAFEGLAKTRYGDDWQTALANTDTLKSFLQYIDKTTTGFKYDSSSDQTSEEQYLAHLQGDTAAQKVDERLKALEDHLSGLTTDASIMDGLNEGLDLSIEKAKFLNHLLSENELGTVLTTGTTTVEGQQQHSGYIQTKKQLEEVTDDEIKDYKKQLATTYGLNEEETKKINYDSESHTFTYTAPKSNDKNDTSSPFNGFTYTLKAADSNVPEGADPKPPLDGEVVYTGKFDEIDKWIAENKHIQAVYTLSTPEVAKNNVKKQIQAILKEYKVEDAAALSKTLEGKTGSELEKAKADLAELQKLLKLQNELNTRYPDTDKEPGVVDLKINGKAPENEAELKAFIGMVNQTLDGLGDVPLTFTVGEGDGAKTLDTKGLQEYINSLSEGQELVLSTSVLEGTGLEDINAIAVAFNAIADNLKTAKISLDTTGLDADKVNLINNLTAALKNYDSANPDGTQRNVTLNVIGAENADKWVKNLYDNLTQLDEAKEFNSALNLTVNLTDGKGNTVSYVDSYSNLLTENAQLIEDNGILTEEKNQLTQDNAALSGTVSDLTTIADSQKAQIADLTSTNASLEATNAELTAANAALEAANDELAATIASTKATLAAADELLARILGDDYETKYGTASASVEKTELQPNNLYLDDFDFVLNDDTFKYFAGSTGTLNDRYRNIFTKYNKDPEEADLAASFVLDLINGFTENNVADTFGILLNEAIQSAQTEGDNEKVKDLTAIAAELSNITTEMKKVPDEETDMGRVKQLYAEYGMAINQLIAQYIGTTGKVPLDASGNLIQIDLTSFDEQVAAILADYEANPAEIPVGADTINAENKAKTAVSLINGMSATLNVTAKITQIDGSGFVFFNNGNGDGGNEDGPVKYTGNVNGIAYADGNVDKLVKGAHLAHKTLVGELGPELGVWDGQYHLLGRDGAEFVNMPSDAIVFNHRQTEGILKGQMGYRGKALADGNVSPARASSDGWQHVYGIWPLGDNFKSYDDFLKSLKSSGKKSVKTTDLSDEDLEEWYNLLRKIAKLEAEINLLQAERENMLDGHDILKSYREEQAYLNEQIAVQKLLIDYQKEQLKLEAERIKQDKWWSKSLTFDEDGTLLSIFGNEVGGGKGVFAYLDMLNNMSGDQQVAALKALGYSYKGKDGKALEGEELVKQFVKEYKEVVSDYNDLENSIYEGQTKVEQLTKAISDLETQITENQKELEKSIYDLLVDAAELEIEQMEEQHKLIQEANEKYIKGLNDALSKEKDLYESNQSIEKREALQRELSLLRRSGGSASEIAELEQQLDDTLKTEYFDKQQQMIEDINEANEHQTELMERQVKLQEDALEYQKENGVLWTKVYEILGGSYEEILAFFTGHDTEFFKASVLEQESMLLEWAKMVGIYDEDRISKQAKKDAGRLWENGTIEQMLANDKTVSEYTDKEGKKQTKTRQQQYNELSDKDKKAAQDHYNAAYADAVLRGQDSETASRTAYDSMVERFRLDKDVGITRFDPRVGGSTSGSGNNNSGNTQYVNITYQVTPPEAKAAGCSISGPSRVAVGTQKGGIVVKTAKGWAKAGWTSSNSTVAQISSGVITAHKKGSVTITQKYWKRDDDYESKANSQSETAIRDEHTGILEETFINKGGFKITNNGTTLFTSSEKYKTKDEAKSAAQSKMATYDSTTYPKLKYSLYGFSKGGLVDYTGLAVVHGSQSKPEAFLNASQTAQITEALRETTGKESVLEGLRSTMDKLRALVHNISTIDNSNNQNISIAPGAVVIQVEQLADSYDIDEVSRDVMNRMVTIANKATNRGVSRR